MRSRSMMMLLCSILSTPAAAEPVPLAGVSEASKDRLVKLMFRVGVADQCDRKNGTQITQSAKNQIAAEAPDLGISEPDLASIMERINGELEKQASKNDTSVAVPFLCDGLIKPLPIP